MIPGAVSIAVVGCVSYLLGSIPTSIILGRLLRGIDIRSHGSGNAGATNTFRVLGTGPGVIAIAVDVGKAVLATLVVSRLGDTELLSAEGYSLIAGSSAVVGHIWTVFARFKGGKGVGAAAGMLLSLYPIAFLCALALFLTGIMLTGIVSVGSITAAISFPLVIWIFDLAGLADYSTVLKVLCIPVGLLILFTHRNNIRRLIAGTESRFPRLMLLRSSRAKARAAKTPNGSDENREAGEDGPAPAP